MKLGMKTRYDVSSNDVPSRPSITLHPPLFFIPISDA